MWTRYENIACNMLQFYKGEMNLVYSSLAELAHTL